MTEKEPQEHKIVVYLYKDIDQGELFVEINEVLMKHFQTEDIVVFFEKPDEQEASIIKRLQNMGIDEEFLKGVEAICKEHEQMLKNLAKREQEGENKEQEEKEE